jgi:co-chaperonin GroES (HSP10)
MKNTQPPGGADTRDDGSLRTVTGHKTLPRTAVEIRRLGRYPGGYSVTTATKVAIKPLEDRVLAVGPGRIDDKGNRVPLDVAVGDKVIYSKYGGTEVKYAGEEYLLLSSRDILAVVEK